MTDDVTTMKGQMASEPAAMPAVSKAPPAALQETAPVAGTSVPDTARARTGGRGGRERGGMRERGQRREPRERVRPEFDQKTLQVRRVARVVAGGRRFNFSVLLALGNRKGAVGVGTGKGADTALAIEKATRSAKKNMLHLVLTKNRSIPYPLEAKYSSARIVMIPARGRGLIAGSAVRAVLELAGVTDVNAKILSGSKNQLNLAQAATAALSALQVPKEGKNAADIPNLRKS